MYVSVGVQFGMWSPSGMKSTLKPLATQSMSSNNLLLKDMVSDNAETVKISSTGFYGMHFRISWHGRI